MAAKRSLPFNARTSSRTECLLFMAAVISQRAVAIVRSTFPLFPQTLPAWKFRSKYLVDMTIIVMADIFTRKGNAKGVSSTSSPEYDSIQSHREQWQIGVRL